MLLRARRRAAPRRPRRSDMRARRRTACCSARPPTDAQRVPSFDGVPLDVDVTLPATGDGPFPTIVMMHGYGGNKTNFEATDPSAGQGYNNLAYAQRGYAVVTYSARGFGRSCGAADSRTAAGLRPRLDPPRRPALRGARHPAPARPARRPGRDRAGPDRRDRHLLRRHPVAEPRPPEGPRAAARRQLRAVDEPGRQAAEDRRGVRALGRLRPHLRAHPERPLPRLPRLHASARARTRSGS